MPLQLELSMDVSETKPVVEPPSREGYVAVPGGHVWYRMVGTTETDAAPLVVLHGGPGYPSDYLMPLAELAHERPVVFYDQLGCGRSERPERKELWTIERAVIELAEVRKALGLSRVHLLGHSWGTMIAIDYAITWPEGLLSLILASPCVSIPMWIKDAERLRKALPEDVQAVLTSGERNGDFTSFEYQKAVEVYYANYVCREQPKPDVVSRSDYGAGAEVYTTMWGPNEFTLLGTLKDYDRTHRLQDLSLPVLYTCGRFDEATPETTTFYHEQTPDSALVVFEHSAHLPHVSEQELYAEAVSGFLSHLDEKREWDITLQRELEKSTVGIFFTLLAVGFAIVMMAYIFLGG